MTGLQSDLTAYVARAGLAAGDSARAREVAKLRLLDYVGSLAAGFDGDTSRIFAEFLGQIGGREHATFAPTGFRTSSPNAAAGNAAVAHSCETDDVHIGTTGYHPGATLIPAVLAVGEAGMVHGDHLLRAIVAGYEVGGRIGACITPSHRNRGFHATGTIGVLGAAAGAAVALRLPEDQLISAIGLATSMSAGTFAVLAGGAQGKHLHAAHAAMSGVVSALLSANGMKGSSRALEAEGGFFAAFSDDHTVARLLNGPDDGHEIDQVMVKPYPCCAHAFGAVEFAVDLARRVELHDIASVTIRTYSAAAVLDDKAPTSPDSAKLSIPYCVAAALKSGSLSSRNFTRDSIADVLASGLVERINVIDDPEATAAFPEDRLVDLTLLTRSGRSFERSAKTPPGFPGRAVARADIIAKFRAAAAPVFGAAAEEIEACILAFDTCPNGAGHLGRIMMPSARPVAAQRAFNWQKNDREQRNQQ